jgi:hypothetical protein
MAAGQGREWRQGMSAGQGMSADQGRAWRQEKARQCREGGMAWHGVASGRQGMAVGHFIRAGHCRVGYGITAGQNKASEQDMAGGQG